MVADAQRVGNQTEFRRPGMSALRQRFRVTGGPLLAYSVEKLISQAHVILQANAKVAENPQ
jgi:hypothetical protein